MVSHTSLGGLELSVGKGGLRFKKRASGFNVCIGNKLRGTAGPTNGGRYDKGFQDKFVDAAIGCGANVDKAAYQKKRGIGKRSRKTKE